MAYVEWTVESCLYPMRCVNGEVEVLLALSRTGTSAGKWVPIGSPVPATSGIREHIERNLEVLLLRGSTIRLRGIVTELAPQWRETLVFYTAHGAWDFTPPPDGFAAEYRWFVPAELSGLPMPQADSAFDYSFLIDPDRTYEATMRFDAEGILHRVEATDY